MVTHYLSVPSLMLNVEFKIYLNFVSLHSTYFCVFIIPRKCISQIQMLQVLQINKNTNKVSFNSVLSYSYFLELLGIIFTWTYPCKLGNRLMIISNFHNAAHSSSCYVNVNVFYHISVLSMDNSCHSLNNYFLWVVL